MNVRNTIIGLIATVLAGFGVWYGITWYTVPGEVLIRGVGYNGIYTGQLLTGSGAASLRSVLQYWKNFDRTLPEPSLASLNDQLPFIEKATPGGVAEVAESLGYETRTVRLGSPRAIARYLEKERTPLLFYQRMEPDFQGIHFPFRVLIGVSMDREVITVHDTFLGPTYEMSFDTLANNFPDTWTNEQKSRFLEIRPANYQTLLANNASLGQYKDRSPYNQFTDIALAYVYGQDGNASDQERAERLIQVIKRPDYEKMPQRFKMSVLTSISLYLSNTGNYLDAKNYAEQAVALNNNLDRSTGVWEGLPSSEHPRPWVRLGDAKLGLGDKKGAAEDYRTALGIDPDDRPAQDGLAAATQ